MTTQTRKLRELLDKQALEELVLDYCRAVDRRDFALIRSLYHDDAIDDHGYMFKGSADEYVRWLPGNLAPFEATVHSVSNMLFRVDGDRAEGEIYAVAYHRTGGTPSREITIGGRYLDRYQRRDGAWKFYRRSLALDWCNLSEADPEAYREMSLGAPPGSIDAQDPSYSVLSMFGRHER